MTTQTTATLDYAPRWYQTEFEEAMFGGCKRAYLLYHRRAGKDYACWNFLVNCAIADTPALYYYILPTYTQGKKVVWEGIDESGRRFIDVIPQELIDGRPNATEMKIRLRNGSIIQVVGSDNYDALRGTNAFGVVLSEYAMQCPQVWEEVLSPILVKNGGWAVINTCVAPETLVFTDNGIRRIDALGPHTPGYYDADLNIYGLGGFHKAEEFYSGGRKKLLKITTKKGYEIRCTPNHPLWTGERWQRSDEYAVGDHIPIQLDQQCWGKGIDISQWKRPKPIRPRSRWNKLPEDPMTLGMFYLMGLYLAEGSMSRPGVARGGAITITNSEAPILKFLQENGFSQAKDGIHSRRSGTETQSLFEWFGLSGTASVKRLPHKLFECRKDQVVSFLKGYFDGDGTINNKSSGQVSCCSSSELLIKELQILLLNFGIVSRRRLNKVEPTERVKAVSHIWSLEMEGHFAYRFMTEIGFRLERKQERVALFSDKIKDGRGDIVPIDASKVRCCLPKNLVTNPSRIGYRKIQQLLETRADEHLESIVEEGFYWDSIATIEDDEDDVFDFVIPDTHSFCSNGVISHNTPKGKNHAYDLWCMAQRSASWYTKKLTIADTGLVTSQRIDQERAEGKSEEILQQEYYCSWEIGTKGAYYSKEMADADAQGRIGRVPVDPNLLVYTAWDLGYSDAMAIIFFQKRGSEILIVDHYENHGFALSHYLDVLRSKGYAYGNHYVPHDGANHSAITGDTYVTAAAKLGFAFEVVPTNHVDIEVGINKVRGFFPRFLIDKDKCDYLIKCLLQYHAEWSDKAMVFRRRPHHDWSSHTADACRVLAFSLDKIDQAIGGMSIDEIRALRARRRNFV
jgi:hypothetical protein